MAPLWFRRDWAALRPWLTGMVALAGLIWVIAWLLDAQQITKGAESAEQEAAASATSPSTTATQASNTVAVPLADLLPLGPEDDRFRVVVRGTVVGAPIADGFWILTDEDEVLFVQTTRPTTSGEDEKLTGTLHQMPAADGAARAQQAHLREAAGWKVHHNLYLEADGAGVAPASPAARRDSSGDTT